MGRGKVQMKLIENQRQRKKTYRTRKEGLKKKIYELSTLCDIDAALVCFDPTGGGGGQVDMWPNDVQRVQDIFTRYYSSSISSGWSRLTAATGHGCDEQQQPPVDQEALLESRLNSVRERIHYLLTNMRKENKCKEMVTVSADHYSHEDHHHHRTMSTSFKQEIKQDSGGGGGGSNTWSCYNNSISIPDHADAGLGGLLDYDQYYPYQQQQQQQLMVFDPVPLAASFDWAMDGTIFDCGVTTTDHAAAAATVTDFAQLLLPPQPVLLDAEPLAVAPPLMSDNNNYHVVMHGGHDVADAGTGHGSPMDGINIGVAQSSSDQLPAADWYWSI